MKNNKYKKNELMLLRFFAILLITNSHLNSFYPSKLFATGGSLGNSIFFFISAIGLTLSLDKKFIKFNLWYKKRFFRLYPIVWIILLSNLYFYDFPINYSLVNWLTYFSAINSYWFIPILACSYIALYYFINYYSIKKLSYFLFFLISIYSIWYIYWIDKNSFTIEADWSIKILFYFIVFIFGIGIAKNYESIKYKGKKDFYIFIFLTLFYFGIKYFFIFFSFYSMQFFIHVITLFWLFSFLKILKNENILNHFFKKYYIGLIISTVSSITLEIYLLQGRIIHLNLWENIFFPLNIILFWFMMIPFAWIVHILYKKSITLININKDNLEK